MPDHPRPNPTDPNADLAGRPVGFYFTVLKFPVLTAIVLGAITIIVALRMEILWVIDIVVFASVGWKLARTYHVSPGQGAVAGAIGGIATGLVVAIIRTLTFRAFYHVFFIVTDPVLIGLLGAGVTALTVWAADHVQKTTSSVQRKGGGRRGSNQVQRTKE